MNRSRVKMDFSHIRRAFIFALLPKVNVQYTTIVKSNVLRRTDVPETREAGYQRQPNIGASERDEENEEPGRLSTVRQSFDFAACLGEHELSNENERIESRFLVVDRPITQPTIPACVRSYAFAGERTSSNIWRDRRRNTREQGAAVRGGHPWMSEATRLWTQGPTGGTTSTADTAPATASTNAGPKKFTARLVSSSFYSPSSCFFDSSSSAGSVTTSSAMKLHRIRCVSLRSPRQ